MHEQSSWTEKSPLGSGEGFLGGSAEKEETKTPEVYSSLSISFKVRVLASEESMSIDRGCK